MSDSETEWFANDAFWEATYSFMFTDARLAAAPSEVDQIIGLAACNEGHVLDLACGPGRHSVSFARRGFRVTGVDRSPFLLERARASALDSGVDVEWIESDMRAFRRLQAFDLAICLFTSFGFFRDDDDNQQVLTNVAASLKPGGAFVLDVLGKEVLARKFTATSSRDLPDGVIVHRHQIIDDWSRIRNDWIILRDGASRTFQFSHWLYSARELKDMFRRAGFAQLQVYGDLTGAAYGADAMRLIVMGRTATSGDRQS
jgi:SAM-dependent methyltransferase